MTNSTISAAFWLFAGLALVPPVQAQAPDTLEVPEEPSIAWFGSWEAGLAEAQRTGRPILIMSAAPQCSGVPGMW